MDGVKVALHECRNEASGTESVRAQVCSSAAPLLDKRSIDSATIGIGVAPSITQSDTTLES
jgi:hypothetical protein